MAHVGRGDPCLIYFCENAVNEREGVDVLRFTHQLIMMQTGAEKDS